MYIWEGVQDIEKDGLVLDKDVERATLLLQQQRQMVSFDFVVMLRLEGLLNTGDRKR